MLLAGRGPRRELGLDGGDVGEATLPGALIEPELHGLLCIRGQCQLFGVVAGFRGGHALSVAKGCDGVPLTG